VVWEDGGGDAPSYPIVRQVCFASGGASPLRAVMARTARLGKGVRREAESEESRCPQLGFDEQKPDTRPASSGNPAMVGDAQ